MLRRLLYSSPRLSSLRKGNGMIRLSKDDLERIAKKDFSDKQIAEFVAEKYDRKSVIKEALEYMYFPDSKKESLNEFVEQASKTREQAQFPSRIR